LKLYNYNSHNSHNRYDNWIAFDLEWQTEALYESHHLENINSKLPIPHQNIGKITSGVSEPPEPDYYDRIITFGFEDSQGNRDTLDISDFLNCYNPQQALLIAIKDKLLQYRYCFAWGSKAVKHVNEVTGKLEGINGDLVVLDINFRLSGIASIIRYDNFSGIPYVKGTTSDEKTTDIDLLQVFAKPLVKYVMFKNQYKSLHLNAVAVALLGYGKLDCKSGADILKLSIPERKAYCMNDAHIIADLIKLKEGDIMKTMQVIANHTGLKLEDACHKGMTGIWTKILNDTISKRISLVGYDNIPNALRNLYTKHQMKYEYKQTEEDLEEFELEGEGGDDNDDYREDQEENWYSHIEGLESKKNVRNNYVKYKGAIVLQPVKGLHHDVYLFDVTSLYPTMIILYNLSPETVNCHCCKNRLDARVQFSHEIMNDFRHLPNEGYYWICKQRRGLFAKKLEELTEQRILYKKAGQNVESQAIKAIINSGYGVFGYQYFKYYDPMVAELVTAFGRDTLIKMQSIATELGFVVLYGDTDSLFLNNLESINDAQQFIDKCKLKLGIAVEHEKTFIILILVGKKHYVGILSDPNREPIIKGMEGIKSDRPEFIHRVFRQLVDDIKNNTDPIPKLRQAFHQLDSRQIPAEQLAISLVLRKNPEDYTQICKQRILGTKLGLHKNDTLVYHKCDKQEIIHDPVTNKDVLRMIHESENAMDISYAEYKDMLVKSVKDVLDILGYDIEIELLNKQKLIHSRYSRRMLI
jgi:DNA polymerase I